MDKFVLSNTRMATMAEGSGYGLVDRGAVAISDGKIVWAGEHSAMPAEFASYQSEDLEGRLITPGLIDCHTHVVFGGNRAREFEMRLEGATYEEVARAGGGIVSTVSATRKASFESLLKDALTRVDALIAEGVTTLEIKSGYGLDVETEIKMLRVAREIGKLRPLIVKTSFLGAHAIPPEFKDAADQYIDEVCIQALETAHSEKLVDAVDGFCEGIAFSPKQIERVFKKASQLGLPVKLHAEQLSNLEGAVLAARYNAISVDHLEYLDEKGVKAMAEAGSIAVMLPGAFYTLRESQLPPIELLRKHGVPMAVATDCNPGSSPLASLLLAMNMACTIFRMTPEEAMVGITRHAAKALGVSNAGVIAPDMRADLCVWDVEHPAEFSYRIGFNPLYQRYFGGANV